MLRRSSFLFASIALLGACSCDPEPPPGDGGPPDAPLPPGDRGRVLGVPETAALDVEGLEGEVYVLYTEAGVPHVYASTEHDLRLVQGFLFARDRYFQLELMRRYARGELADLVGTPGLTIDIRNRGLGKLAIAARLWSLLSSDEQAIWEAHADGVNAYIDAVANGDAPGPSELGTLRTVLGASRVSDLMDPVSGEDLVSILGEIVFQFGFEDGDLALTEAVAAAADSLASDPRAALLLPALSDDVVNRFDPATPVTSVECASPPCFALDGGGTSPFFPPLRIRRRGTPMPLEHGLGRRARALSEHLAAPHGGHGADFGSNAWAVGSSGTPGGGAVLAGDGHLPLHVPTLLTQIGLDTSVFGDGADPLTQIGCFLPGVPFMALGTNGSIAWSFTYQNADATDWFREELVLDAAGLPMATVFGAENRPLVAIDETYHVAEVEYFMSADRDETWRRWTTFDGRPIVLIEGHEPAAGETAIVRPDGEPIVPGDEDGDGVVTAISVDHVSYDISNIIRMLRGFGAAGSVEDFRSEIRRNVAFTSNFVAADQSGSVLYTSYSGTPCRADRRTAGPGSPWAAGADPQALVDGTTYAGFSIPLDGEGLPDEAAGASDPSRCLVPADAWPEALDPARGFVLTANNDIAGTTLDGDVENDPYYIGAAYDTGFRARTIHDELTRLTAANTADAESMAALQASHTSVTARVFLPEIEAAIDVADAAIEVPSASRTPDQARLVALYEPNRARIDEALARLRAWLDAGARTRSGVETFYDPSGAADGDDAVATMIWAETFRRLHARILDDEGISAVLALDPRRLRANLLRRLFEGRGAGNPMMLASWDPATEEPAYFDDRTTAGVTERSEEALVGAIGDALAALEAAPDEDGEGGFGTADMDTWRWGLRHQVRFESIVIVYAGDAIPMADLLLGSFTISTRRLALADPLPTGDPRRDLRWFPRPGDFYDVDAATPSFAVGDSYTYAYGPVMRFAVELEGGRVSGRNIIPGGESGVTSEEHFDDQAALWLGNQTVPLRFHVEDVALGALSRETFRPAS